MLITDASRSKCRANPEPSHPCLTWARRLADYPATDPSYPERTGNGINGTVTYSEGLLVGYRWFDAHGIEPLFPFGHGLSYTRFAYSDLRAVRRAGGIDAVVTVRNVGPVRGDTVAQVYLDAPIGNVAGGAFAPRTLVGFERATLAPGEARTLHVPIARKSFQYWSSSARCWKDADGVRVMRVGLSERDLLLNTTITVKRGR